MDNNTLKLFFALLRSAALKEELSCDERALCTHDSFGELMTLAKRHDLLSMLSFALKKSGLYEENAASLDSEIMKAVYRYRQLEYDLERLSSALETAKIPFIPLKGSVIRAYYPEPWMRTSCDIDVLVHPADLDRAFDCLVSSLGCKAGDRTAHDISLYTPRGVQIELHFDLVEENRASDASVLLNSVWENASPKSGCEYFCEMTDEFFYLYHIAHMAKHFEVGGCGIRPFVDLLILDKLDTKDGEKRSALLGSAGLLKFADAALSLCCSWFLGEECSPLTLKMQNYIISGGVYGSIDNRVALQQTGKGGKLGYIISRVFLPYKILAKRYPVIVKHKWLTPVMQVRRWLNLLKPKGMKKAKAELDANNSIDADVAEEMNKFFKELKLQK